MPSMYISVSPSAPTMATRVSLRLCGLSAFYRGLAIGAMSVVGPLSAESVPAKLMSTAQALIERVR